MDLESNTNDTCTVYRRKGRGIIADIDQRLAPCKFIADNYLGNPVQFNAVRNMLGYTGTHKDKKVSVMSTGMGMPRRASKKLWIQFGGWKQR